MNSKIGWKKSLLLLNLYTTQFIGLGFFNEAFIAILRKNGMPLENLGFVYMLGLFWIFKFLWAPIIDRINFKKLGHYRGWIGIMQTLMFVTLLVISFFDIEKEIITIVLFASLLAFFSATQNIALDALMYKSVEPEDRARGYALKFSGGLIGTLIGGGFSLVIYSYFGWQVTIFVLSLLVLSSLIQLLFFQEEPDKETSSSAITLRSYFGFWKEGNRGRFLIFLLIYPASISSAYGLINPLLVDSGWSLEKIGYIVHVIGYGIGILASFGTSFMVDRYGRKNVLVVSAIGQFLGLGLLLLPTFGFTDIFNVAFAVGIIFLFYTPSSTIISTIMMDKIPNKNPASEYAILHSTFTFAGIVYASLAVFLASGYGYQISIYVALGVGLIAIGISFYIEKFLKEDIELEKT
ncbi:MAG: MFS transporter [Campylobacterales bacterium]|nr:MFS transporter [Campylobacterales bacterium]